MSLAAILGDTARKSWTRLSVVLDGAHFDDLQRELLIAGLEYRSLYLDEQDAPALASGPHLVLISAAAQIPLVLDMVGAKPAAVWWEWPARGGMTFDTAFKHLRSINMVEIPVSADPAARARPGAGRDGGYEAVLFRHGDSNIMAEVLPLLDPTQRARLMGPAISVILDAPNYPGARVAVRDESWPQPAPGLLRLSPAQYAELADAASHRSRLETLSFLREHAAEETAELDDQQLYTQVCEAEIAGLALGIEDNEAHSLYAYMAVTSGGETLRSEQIGDAIRGSRGHPDEVVKSIFGEMIKAAEADS